MAEEKTIKPIKLFCFETKNRGIRFDRTTRNFD